MNDGFAAFMAAHGLPVPCNGCDCVDHAGLDADGYCATCVADRDEGRTPPG